MARVPNNAALRVQNNVVARIDDKTEDYDTTGTT